MMGDFLSGCVLVKAEDGFNCKAGIPNARFLRMLLLDMDIYLGLYYVISVKNTFII
jgi:hypothetical protein